MTTLDAVFHYTELAKSVSFPSSLVFSQLGAFHRTSRVACELDAIFEEMGLKEINFDNLRGDFVNWSSKCRIHEVGVLTGLETLLQDSRCEEVLMQLRPQITLARERGARVLLLSTSPLQNYPSLNSSSILLDASTFSIRPLSSQESADIVRQQEITEETEVSNLVNNASGSRALLEKFCAIHLSNDSGNRKKASANRAERAVARRALEELGPSLCSWLEHWVYECGQSTLASDDIPANIMQALRLAGLIRPGNTTDDLLALLPVKNRTVWLDALGEVLEMVVKPPPEWLRLVEEVFQMERVLRHDLREALEARYGSGWTQTAIPDREQQIILLARRDTTPRVESYADVRSPLDWLSLTDLLEVAAKESGTGKERLLGHSSEDWNDLSRKVVPIRNRIAHMRLARDGDWQALRSLRRTTAMRVQAAAKDSNAAGSPAAN